MEKRTRGKKPETECSEASMYEVIEIFLQSPQHWIAMLLTVHVCARLSSEQISLWKTFSKLQKAFSNTAWSRSVLLCVESARTHRLRDRFHSRRDIISHCTIPHIFPSSSMHFFSLLIFGQHDNDDMKFVCVCALWPHISLSFFFYHPQLSRADDDLVLSAA